MKMNVFEYVVVTFRGAVVNWLCSKYGGLRYEDGEDIVQESSYALYEWGAKNVGLTKEDFYRMWKVMSRNHYTHWLAKHKHHSTEELDDERFVSRCNVDDFCSDDFRAYERREKLYDCLDALSERDHRLMELSLSKTKMRDIALELGYKSAQTAKNRKAKIVADIRKKVAA